MECETQYIRSDRTQILIDIRTCGMTLTEVMGEIQRLQAERPDHEVFMDGDFYAIVSRPKRIVAEASE